MSWYGDIGSGIAGGFSGLFGGGGGPGNADYAPGSRFASGSRAEQADAERRGVPVGSITDQTGQPAPWQFSDPTRRSLLDQQASLGGRFGDASQANYGQLGARGNASLDALQRQANGYDSVSAEQLRQALQQNQAQQMSMAQGGNPQDATSRARTAAIQSARLGSGLAGQQAVAGLQERNQAQGQYSQLLQGLRGQDLQGSLGGRQAAITGYGGNQPAPAPEKSGFEKYGPAIIGGIAAASDRRLKTDVKDGDAGADKMLNALRSFTYRYKDEDKHGKGERTGIMAQDLERAGIKHAVVDTPDGKMVHGAHLATANTAMLAALRRRVEKIEKGR